MANVELVDVNACKKNLIVEIPAEIAQKEYDRVSREFARHARVAGFRPGRTPLGIIKKRFHDEIKKHLIQDLVPRFYQEAIQDKQLKPISEPLLDKVDFEEGGALKFQATFEILPPLRVYGYENLRITVAKRQVTAEDIQKGLESVRQRYARFVPIEDRVAGLGEFVTVNLKGRLADESGIEFQDKNVIIQLGDADSVAGFTENLSGVQAGDIRTFTLQYPADFGNQQLAGKTVHYQADVVAVKQKHLPEIDNDLATEAGDFADLDELKQAIAKSIEAAATQEYEKKVREELLEQVVSMNSFEVPECLVEEELRHLFQRIADQLMRQGVDVQRANIDWKKVAEEDRPKALERARQNLALTAIADQESISLSDDEMQTEVRRLAELAHKTPEAVRAGLAKNDGLEELRRQLRRQKALEWIRQHAAAL